MLGYSVAATASAARMSIARELCDKPMRRIATHVIDRAFTSCVSSSHLAGWGVRQAKNRRVLALFGWVFHKLPADEFLICAESTESRDTLSACRRR